MGAEVFQLAAGIDHAEVPEPVVVFTTAGQESWRVQVHVRGVALVLAVAVDETDKISLPKPSYHNPNCIRRVEMIK